MNVEIGAEAALFPEKKYKSKIFVAVWARAQLSHAQAQWASALPGLRIFFGFDFGICVIYFLDMSKY
jgi:hypothetical protein